MSTLLKLFIVLFVVLLASCAGTVKTYDATTGKKISSVPAGVAVMQAASKQMEDCPSNSPLVFSVDEITKLSASAQAEAVRNIPMLIALGMIQTQEGNCYSQVARETQAFFTAQAIKYQQWGAVGKTGLIGGFTYLGAKSFFDAFTAASASGAITIGTINATKSDDPVGGEGGGGGDVTGSQVVNIGGYTATDHGQVIGGGVDKNISTGFGPKASSNQDDNTDGPNIINDPNDGSGNSARLF